jgi:molybdopterin-guanine dinucleotide biosynthesis protein
MVVWIIGMSATGKTTLAGEVGWKLWRSLVALGEVIALGRTRLTNAASIAISLTWRVNVPAARCHAARLLRA